MVEEHDDNSHFATSSGFAPLIEVVHAFGTSPIDGVRNRTCMLDNARVAYVVGSRVAVVDGNPRGKDRCDSSSRPSLAFLRTGLRVSRVTALACSADKKFVSVCFKATGEPALAYATVYSMLARPKPSRVRIISYRRNHGKPLQQQQQQQPLVTGESCEATISKSGGRKQNGRSDSDRRVRTANAAEFAAADFSHDSSLLALLDGSPVWTLLWFEWKTGKRLFAVEICSPVYRIVCSPSDGSKTAIAGAGGRLQIWSTQGGKACPMASIVGLREVCYRDVAWLSGDRLVVAAREGFVSLMSPGSVLREWDVRDDERGHESSNATHDVDSGIPSDYDATSHILRPSPSSGRGEAITGREGFLNVVVVHKRGFVVGGTSGRLLVFEAESEKGGFRQDAYTLSRVVWLFVAELVELSPGKGLDYRWLLVGDKGGEIGLVDTYELFSSNASSEDKATSVSPTMAGGKGSVKPRGGVKVLSSDAQQDASAATAVLATPAPVATVERKVRPGEAVVCGFANAMDSFENSLKATADAESRSLVEGIPKRSAEKNSCAFASSAAPSSGEQPRTPASLYKPLVRGLGVGERGSKLRQSSWSCLSLCARKPLIAGMAREVYVPTGFSTSHPDYLQNVSDEDKDSAHVGGEVEPGNHAGQNLQGFAAANVGVEIQIWNYRTKRVLLKHGFVGSSLSSGSYEDIGGGAGGVSEVAADKGGQRLAFQSGNEDALPVAISFHPSGDYLAVAFRHFVNIFYIVGGDGEPEGGETSEIDVEVSATDPRSASWSSVAMAHAVAAAEPASHATLRSDQRDFLTKGMFSVTGEENPVVNCDPVSAVHFSTGGQLLAVVTGKMVQILSLYDRASGGRLGRVQTLSGHASHVSSFSWGADDRRCWTTANGYVYEWEVGAGLGRLGADCTHRREFFSKHATFEGVVADPALEGGVAACAISNSNVSTIKRSIGSVSAAVTTTAATLNSRACGLIHVSCVKHSPEIDVVVEKSVSMETENDGQVNSARPCNNASTVLGAMVRTRILDRSDHTIGGGKGGQTLVTSGISPTRRERTREVLHSPLSEEETSSLFVWPGKLEPTAEAGLQARVPYRLTCVRVTPFEDRFGRARNVLLAGTTGGMVVAFDWGCLLRAARNCGGGNRTDRLMGAGGEDMVLPCAQVCLHSRPVHSLALTADGNHLFTAASDGAVFMCRVQLKGRWSFAEPASSLVPEQVPTGGMPCSTPNKKGEAAVRRTMEVTGTAWESARATGVTTATTATTAGVSTALEACVEEGMLLMEEETVRRLQTKALSAHRELDHVRNQARFGLEKERRAHAKTLEVSKVAAGEEISRLEGKVESLRRSLVEAEREKAHCAKDQEGQRRREALALQSMYEKKLGLQAESYIQLKAAYEELSQAARDDAGEMQAKAEAARKVHENNTREDMEQIVEDQQLLKSYVEFVGAQCHKTLEDEQEQHNKQLSTLLAAKDVAQMEKARVRDEAKTEVAAVKTKLRALSKRMNQRCTREEDATTALAATQETVKQLEARVEFLEQEVRAKAMRLSEWENMGDKQKTAIIDLERLKKALTLQLVEQRTQLEGKDAVVTKMRGKLSRSVESENECARQICTLQKELAVKDRQFTCVRSEVDRLKTSLKHREALLKGTATRVMSVLDTATAKDHWLVAKKQLGASVSPLLERGGLDGLDTGDTVVEQARQIATMQENIHKMREALRQEHQNNEQRNLVRVGENLELTRELNLARKKSTALEGEMARLEATIKKLERELHRSKHTRRLPLHPHTVPDFRRSNLVRTGEFGMAGGTFRNLFADKTDAIGLRPFSGEAVPEEPREYDTPLHTSDPRDDLPARGTIGAAAADRTGPPGAIRETPVGALTAAGTPTRGLTASLRNAIELNYQDGDSSTKTPLVQGVEGCEQRHGEAIEGNIATPDPVSQLTRNSASLLTKSTSAPAATTGGKLRVHPDTRTISYTKGLPRPEGGRVSSDPGYQRRSSTAFTRRVGSEIKRGRRVLLPGKGARDYTSLLKGTEALRLQELESRAATAEAEASQLAHENHRLAIELRRRLASRDAEAARAVGALSAELEALRTRELKLESAVTANQLTREAHGPAIERKRQVEVTRDAEDSRSIGAVSAPQETPRNMPLDNPRLGGVCRAPLEDDREVIDSNVSLARERSGVSTMSDEGEGETRQTGCGESSCTSAVVTLHLPSPANTVLASDVAPPSEASSLLSLDELSAGGGRRTGRL